MPKFTTHAALAAALEDKSVRRVTQWIGAKGKTRIQILVVDGRVRGGLRPLTLTLVEPENATARGSR